MRDQGAAVLLVSAELDEVLTLSDRIGVIYRGALVGTFDRADATRDAARPAHGQRRTTAEAARVTSPTPTAAPTAGWPGELRQSIHAPAGARPALRHPPRPRRRRASSSCSSASNPLEAYWALLRGMFGSADRIAASLGRSTPFIGAALAVAFAFRAGLFNIGAEGQLLVGATAGRLGRHVQLRWPTSPGPIAIPMILLAGALGGGCWGWHPRRASRPRPAPTR